MCAKDMGIILGNPADFQEWVIAHENNFNELLTCPHHASPNDEQCNHYPREIMGEYLEARFREAHQKAQSIGLGIDLFAMSEVIDLEEKNDKIHLSVMDLRSGSIFSRVTDRVLLATGHWFEKAKSNRYFPSPWPASDLLNRIPEGEKVAVIGTSLSAIEVVLTLTSEGQFIRDDSERLVYMPPPNPRRLTLYSRRGFLPRVRGKMGKYRNKFLTRNNIESLIAENQGYLNLEAVFQLLNMDLEAAYGHKINWREVVNPGRPPADLLKHYLKDARIGDDPDGELIWQTVLHQSFDMLREIYLRLSLEDRERFDNKYTSVFFSHAATQPTVNAEKMLALMKSGLVEVIKLGRDYKFNRNNTKEVYEFIYKGAAGNTKTDAYRYVVNARGQAKSLEADSASLTKNLLKRNIVQTAETHHIQPEEVQGKFSANQQDRHSSFYKTGSMWIDPSTHNIVRHASVEKRTRSNSIYAVGAMTRGQIIDSSMAQGIVQSTAIIAEDLVNYLKQWWKEGMTSNENMNTHIKR
jgi:uncharacterized NAD(P)/FAD-binding protein YdhS